MLQKYMQVVEQNKKRHARRLSRSVRLRQHSVDWINKPLDAETVMEKWQIQNFIRSHNSAALYIRGKGLELSPTSMFRD